MGNLELELIEKLSDEERNLLSIERSMIYTSEVIDPKDDMEYKKVYCYEVDFLCRASFKLNDQYFLDSLKLTIADIEKAVKNKTLLKGMFWSFDKMELQEAKDLFLAKDRLYKYDDFFNLVGVYNNPNHAMYINNYPLSAISLFRKKIDTKDKIFNHYWSTGFFAKEVAAKIFSNPWKTAKELRDSNRRKPTTILLNNRLYNDVKILASKRNENIYEIVEKAIEKYIGESA